MNFQRRLKIQELRLGEHPETAEVIPLIKQRRQSDLLTVDETLSEFEWARVTSKTWDMEQG